MKRKVAIAALFLAALTLGAIPCGDCPYYMVHELDGVKGHFERLRYFEDGSEACQYHHDAVRDADPPIPAHTWLVACK